MWMTASITPRVSGTSMATIEIFCLGFKSRGRPSGTWKLCLLWVSLKTISGVLERMKSIETLSR